MPTDLQGVAALPVHRGVDERKRPWRSDLSSCWCSVLHPDFHGEVIGELERLKENDTVRVIDALAVYKDADGNVEVGT